MSTRMDVESSRVNEIDLLRFLAAFCVVIFHYAFRGYAAEGRSDLPYPLLAPIAKYGYLGVELFFLISGFVILMTAARGDLRSFAVSRFVRLYPAFWACCTITFVAILLIGGGRYSASITQYLVNMTMLSGFVGVPSIDGVYWSLFVELQFYGLIAALLLIGRIHQAQGFLLLWLGATILLEFVPINALRFLLIADYSAYFIAGAMCFLIWSSGMTLMRMAAIFLSLLLALHGALGGLAQFERHYSTQMNLFVITGIITTYFVVMLLIATRRIGFLGRRRWLIAGALTYPLYLIHQNLGFMIFNLAYPVINQHVLFWGTILLMLGTAYAVHVLIERSYSPILKRIANDAIDQSARHLSRLRESVFGRAPPGTVTGPQRETTSLDEAEAGNGLPPPASQALASTIASTSASRSNPHL